jgi:uncharacterized RDD family membrane protein YckC
MTIVLIGTTRPPRHGAAIIDHVLAFVSLFAVGSFLGQRILSKRSDETSILIGLAVFAVYFLYYFLFEWLFSATPGKLLTGLTVRYTDGSRLGAKAAFIRTLTRLIEVNPLLLGGLPAAIIVRKSRRHQRWGDQLAGTVVVEAASVSRPK